MRRLAWQLDLPSLSSTIVVGIALLVAILIGGTISRSAIGPRELAIVILVILTAILVLVPADRILKLGLVGWVLTFGFGWRTFHVTSAISIHPAEALAWLLFFLILGHRIIRREKLDLHISVLVPILMVFAVAGIWTGVGRSNELGYVVQESKILFALIPSYYLVLWLITTRAEWERVVQVATLVAVYVSCLGLLDALDPAISRALVGSQSAETTSVSVQGFDRAGFIFFGSPAAAFLILMFLGFAINSFLVNLGGNWFRQLLSGVALVIELGAIYVSGYRGTWLATVAMIVVFAVLWRRAWVLMVGTALGLPMLPSDFFHRLISLFDLRYADSSQFKRLDRATAALDLVRQSPILGVGWAGSGYVHSDLIQLAANLGVPALVVFLAWVIQIAGSLFQLVQREGWIRQFAVALLANLCGLMISLAAEGLIVWAQLMVPAWFVFAMAVKLREFAALEDTDDRATPVNTALPAASLVRSSG